MNKIENMRFGEERALYNINNSHIVNCRFEGLEDGESALKEASNLLVDCCYFDLRYPFWHTNNAKINKAIMTTNCRAALWYCDDIMINDSQMGGIKALRECRNIIVNDTSIDSPEFGWRNENITFNNCLINGEYAFFESKQIMIDRVTFSGKYSFQYVENMEIRNSKLNTKDAFWHTNNVTVYDSEIIGEYLGWYSTNLTLVRCKIKGTQPLCYCHKLKLVDCTMENADLAFEYSDVDASIIGSIDSIKNPRSGSIIVDDYREIIIKDSKYPVLAEILKRNK